MRLAWLLAFAGGGVITGFLISNRVEPAPSFSVADWPASGMGEELVEFYDPACAMSRELDREIDLEILVSPSKIKRVLVPVAVFTSSPPLVLSLCESSDDEAFRLARIYDDVESSKLPTPIAPQGYSRRRNCQQLIDAAGTYIKSITNDGIKAPIVRFRDRFYFGLEDFPELKSEIAK